MKIILCLIALSATLSLAADPKTYNVRDFGAGGSGTDLDTDAINRAIDACAKAGGGRVLFPAGTYASYSIHLRSNVELHLDKGATILAADPPPLGEPGGYDPPEPNEFNNKQDFGHSHWQNSLIWGDNLENISITGSGRIYGRGLSSGAGDVSPLPPGEKHKPKIRGLTPDKNDNTQKPDNKSKEKPKEKGALRDGVGNKAISLKNCRNIRMTDFTIYHGGHFAILATGCDDMVMDKLIIDTNRDGIDIDCCRNTTVTNCRINSPRDDGLCPKSSYGLGEKRLTENLTIDNCQVSGCQEGSLIDGRMLPRRQGTGRIKFGTESTGGFRNCTITNCTFINSRGLAIEQVDGGIIDNIKVDGITMTNVIDYVIFIRLGARNRGPDGTTTGTVRNISISNITATGSDPLGPKDPLEGVEILGTPGHPVEGVRLKNIKLTLKGGGTEEDAKRTPPELENGYPEPSFFGVMPAYGLFARHARDLEIENFQVSFETKDLRPAIAAVDVAGLKISGFKAQVADGVAPSRFEDVKDIVIRNSPVLEKKP